jgi:hypothetical protein
MAKSLVVELESLKDVSNIATRLAIMQIAKGTKGEPFFSECELKWDEEIFKFQVEDRETDRISAGTLDLPDILVQNNPGQSQMLIHGWDLNEVLAELGNIFFKRVYDEMLKKGLADPPKPEEVQQ